MFWKLQFKRMFSSLKYRVLEILMFLMFSPSWHMVIFSMCSLSNEKEKYCVHSLSWISYNILQNTRSIFGNNILDYQLFDWSKFHVKNSSVVENSIKRSELEMDTTSVWTFLSFNEPQQTPYNIWISSSQNGESHIRIVLC